MCVQLCVLVRQGEQWGRRRRRGGVGVGTAGIGTHRLGNGLLDERRWFEEPLRDMVVQPVPAVPIRQQSDLSPSSAVP